MRILLTVLLPLVGPLVLYRIWNMLMLRRRQSTVEPTPQITRGGLFVSLLAGWVLTSGRLSVIALTGNHGGEGKYMPPRTENGRIIPGHFE